MCSSDLLDGATLRDVQYPCAVLVPDLADGGTTDDEGEGLRRLNNILLTYSFYNFDLSYCQVPRPYLARYPLTRNPKPLPVAVRAYLA